MRLSATFPSSITKISLACHTDPRGCPTQMVVLHLCAASNALCTTFSLSVSNELVASFSNKILVSRSRARAIVIRCFWPPEIRLPREPITVENRLGVTWWIHRYSHSCKLVLLSSQRYLRLSPAWYYHEWSLAKPQALGLLGRPVSDSH
jgi:hypothetical protein